MSQSTQRNGRRATWNASGLGALLIGIGGLLLLANMGIIRSFGGVIGLLIVGGLGAWLLNIHYTEKRQAWLLFTGWTLLGCAAATVTGSHAGVWFLALSGIGFLQAWREDDRMWWSLMPAGTLFTLAAVTLAEQSVGWLSGGTVFFAGLAATFLAIYMLPRHAQQWALIPAVGSAVMALIVWGSTGSWILPLVLIGTGLWLLGNRGVPVSSARSHRRRSGRPEADDAVTAQLPEEISSTGPDIPERWTEQDGPDDRSE